MTKKEQEVKEIIEQAVARAYDAGVTGMDEKIQAAVNLGVTTGVEIGAKMGAQAGAEAGIKAVERERRNRKERERDWKYHNTKLLLRNYRRLSSYYENAVFDQAGAEQEGENFYELMSNKNSAKDDDVLVSSIMQDHAKTKIIMVHMNKMLGCYRAMCERSGRTDDQRHWRILDRLYLSGEYTTADRVAEEEHVDKRTVYRDIDACTADLATLLFGVGAMEAFME